MSNHSVPYFLNLYNSVANDNCKIFFDFNPRGNFTGQLNLSYNGATGAPEFSNTLGRVKVFQNSYGPYIDPEHPDMGFQSAGVAWKRCDSTSTYNDENYTDVRHDYNVGDLIRFTSYSVYNGLSNIIKPITEVTDTTFTISGSPADEFFAARPAVYNCSRISGYDYTKDSTIINKSGIRGSLDGKIISNVNSFWRNSGYGLFSGNAVKIENTGNSINISDATYVMVYENLASGGGTLISTIDTGNGASGLYYKGYEFGFTANNALYFEYYTNNGPQVFTSNSTLSDKGCVYLTVTNGKVSFGDYNYFYSQFNANNFLIDSNYLFDSKNIFIGYNSEITNGYTYNKRFTGYMEQFLTFSPSIYTNDILYLSSGFAHSYVPDTIYTQQTVINQITGYSTGITGYYTGVTGYSVIATGVTVDDFGIQYTGYSELELTGIHYGTGVIPLAGEVIIESTGYSGAYVNLHAHFIKSFGKSRLNILKNVKESDIVDVSVPSGNYDYNHRINLNGQYDYVKNSFFNNYLSNGNYFFNVFKNGFVKISGASVASGDVYNVQNIILNDYTSNSNNTVLFASNSNASDIIIFDSIANSYNTGLYIKGFNLNMSGYSNSGSGIILPWPTIGNRLFFGGKKMVSGQIQNIGINCDYAVTQSGLFFSRATGVFSANTGDLLSLPNLFNINITGKNNLISIANKYPTKYSEVYLSGIRLNINKDYLELASFDANAGSGIFDINTDILYNNNKLF